MEDTFAARIRAAAAATWWTVLVAAVFLAVQWLAYLLIMNVKPGWAVPLLGPEETWDTIRPVWFRIVVYLKVFVWLLALAALWLTLWARQLRSGAGK
jgi:hypothetical protein